ncbi:glycosyltransferase [Algoriphagus machipongonensis]|uniref:Glycosyl transferase n=1 Tax=Algoriphagus machipongonensis TaxID=388413 RepID=A3HRH6_9BACT|nr:glycosyltransferase [Algoriphagus machipongonensis]EAZ82444.1 glycosyl transferase [Algoriphagus machipongonensis]
MVKIDISVVLLTYNQEAYVNKSIDSILNQKFSGSLEIIVVDDCSDDHTFEIIQSKKPINSVLIRTYSNKVNLGLAKNYEKAIFKANGKYIAYLEGDDYWTDPFKLQKQFEFLEKHPECVLSFHDFVTIDKNDKIISDKNLLNKSIKKNRSKKEMVMGCLIHQNTMVFRNVVRKFPLGFFKARNHDTFFISFLSNWGTAGYVECDPLHYRIIENSLWSSLSTRKKHINGLITYLWIFSIVKPSFYFVLLNKILLKMKYILLRF